MAATTTAEAMRQRAADRLDRARATEERIAAGEDVPDSEVDGIAADVSEAERLLQQADSAEQRAQRIDRLTSEATRPRFVNPPFLTGRETAGPPGHDGSALMPHTDPNNTRGGRHGYSVLRAINGGIALREGKGFGGLEAEVHQELLPLRSTPTRGVLIPWDAPASRELFPRGWRFRDLTTTTGAGAVAKVVQPTLIELLRARLVLAQLGATLMTGLWGEFGIPRQSAGATTAWVAEGSSATASNATVDQVQLTPRTLTANTTLTRKFLQQAVIDAENLAVSDLVSAAAQGLERAAINGSGTAPEPRGILQMSGVGVVTLGADGGAMTWKKTLEFVGKLNNGNARLDGRGWLISPLVKAAMGGTPREAGYPKYLYDFDDPASPIAGFPVAETTNMPSNFVKGDGTGLSSAIFGSWPDLVIALFSPMDVLSDPFSLVTSGSVRFAIFQEADVNVRHPESFVKCTEIATS